MGDILWAFRSVMERMGFGPELRILDRTIDQEPAAAGNVETVWGRIVDVWTTDHTLIPFDLNEFDSHIPKTTEPKWICCVDRACN